MSLIFSTPSSLPIGILKTDSDGPVSLYCYKKNVDREEVKQCRGLVYCNDELVFRGRPFVQEYSKEEMTEIPQMPMNELRFFRWREGTVIRVLFVNNKWVISTHRRLNAFKSKWGDSPSFGELFEQSLSCPLNEFLDSLDKKKQYVFLLESSSQTRRIAKANDPPRIFHLDTFVSLTETDPNDDIGLPKLEQVFPSSIEDAFELVESQDPLECQGILAVSTTSLDHFRLVSSIFSVYNQVRGNTPNILIRYLELVKLKCEKSLNTLVFLYPEKEKEFQALRESLSRLIRKIHSEYIQRHIRRNFTMLDPSIHFIIKKCHSRYLETRIPVREQHVIEALLSLDAEHIYKLTLMTQLVSTSFK